jgi:hypothetical protein
MGVCFVVSAERNWRESYQNSRLIEIELSYQSMNSICVLEKPYYTADQQGTERCTRYCETLAATRMVGVARLSFQTNNTACAADLLSFVTAMGGEIPVELLAVTTTRTKTIWNWDG